MGYSTVYFEMSVPEFRKSLLHVQTGQSLVRRCYMYTHPVIFQKTGIFNNTDLRNINPVQFENIYWDTSFIVIEKKVLIFAQCTRVCRYSVSHCRTRECRWCCILFNFRKIFWHLQSLVLCVGVSPIIPRTRLVYQPQWQQQNPAWVCLWASHTQRYIPYVSEFACWGEEVG